MDSPDAARRPRPRPQPGDAGPSRPARGSADTGHALDVRPGRPAEPPAVSTAPTQPAASAAAATPTETPPHVDTEPPLNPNSWLGSLVKIVVFGAVLWIVQVFNAADHYAFNRFGLHPRRVDGLWGVLTQPFLHTSYHHMLSDTLPVLVIGWVVMLSGLRTWALVTAIIVVVGGALAWLWAPAELIVGASSLYFGWLGYIVARAVFSRRIVWIMTAIFVVFFFAALIGQLLPSVNHNESWQAHVAGLVAGVGAAFVLHRRRRGGSPLLRRRAVS